MSEANTPEISVCTFLIKLYKIFLHFALGPLFLEILKNKLSPNRPQGRFGLVVAMSVYLSVCLSPFLVIFFKRLSQKTLDVEWGYYLIIINSRKSYHHCLLSFKRRYLHLINSLNSNYNNGAVLLHSPRLDFFNRH